MLYKNVLVPIPEKKVIFRKAPGGTIYVYFTLKAYRNQQGKPTSEVVIIGKKDHISGQLIPNTRYFELFPSSETEKPIRVSSSHILPKQIQICGTATTIKEIANQIGLSDVLQNCFSESWEQILAVASYILCEGNVMMYIDDWFAETNVNYLEQMTDVDCSYLFASITEEERREFFKEWIQYRGEQEYLAYDVTSFSTYSQFIDIVEWGYNRDNDNLPQINLGMFYGITSNMPVYYHTYSGSIPDKSCLEFMMLNAQDLGIHNTSFVFDCGFVTEDNFKFMYECDISFISLMPSQRKEALKLIDKAKLSIEKIANKLSDSHVYGVQYPISLYGREITAHVFFDQKRRYLETEEICAYIEKLEEELKQKSKSKQITKKFKEYFIINEQAKQSFTYQLDNNKIDEKLGRAGFFILLTHGKKLTCDEALKIYREKDGIEKSFHQFKNPLDFKRMRTHLKKTMEGKMFVGFIALVLRCYMMHLLKSDQVTKKLTFNKVLIELKKIKSVTLTDNTNIMMPLTRLQKNILAAMKIDEVILC